LRIAARSDVGAKGGSGTQVLHGREEEEEDERIARELAETVRQTARHGTYAAIPADIDNTCV